MAVSGRAWTRRASCEGSAAVSLGPRLSDAPTASTSAVVGRADSRLRDAHIQDASAGSQEGPRVKRMAFV